MLAGLRTSNETGRFAVPREAAEGRLTSFDSFAALPSNLSAVRLALSFALGHRPFAVLQGASGWGKTHLLAAVAEHLGARVFSSEEWLSERRFVEKASILIIDDIHRAALRPKSRQLLRFELERRVRSKRPTLCAAACSANMPLKKMLPFRRAWASASIESPVEGERREIVLKMCRNRGLALNDEALQLIASLVRGDAHSLLGALARLKVACPTTAEAQALNPIRVAGLLHPYLIDQTDRDLRDVVLDAVTQCPDRPTSAGERDAVRTLSLAVYVLTNLAGLSESSVAMYFGIKPGYLYKLKLDVAARLELPDPALRNQLDRALNLATRNLCAG